VFDDAEVHVSGATLGKSGQVKVGQALEVRSGWWRWPAGVPVLLQERERTLHSNAEL